MPKQLIFDKKNVLVAGGAGFIGSHLCDRLVREAKVICIDDFISGTEKNIDHLLANPNFVFIKHDLAQPIDLAARPELSAFKVEFQGVQEIYNLACPMSPRHFLDNRLAILQANSHVMFNLLDMAVKYQAKFMHFSSSVVYGLRQGNDPGQKLKESELGSVDQLSERSAYDEGKRFAETIVSNYRSIHGIDTKIMRLFRTYGPRMELDDDQLIPDFVNNALEGRDLVIYGDEKFSSAFCYIDDALDATQKFMETNLAGPLNIGSDVDVNLTDLAKIIIRETGSASKITYAEARLFVSGLRLPDISQAKNALGWMPVVTLENGLKKTIFDISANKRLHGLNV